MKIYLVGGAVRDSLLGLDVIERDWVVVGATADQLIARGFKRVGKDFPVFLHPETAEEYALARTERKTAAGYYGFSVQATPDVSLEDDLKRRDLTINAMARDHDDRLIDPYGGRADLQQRWLRHVSPAFSEDPVRVLRLARFAARYAHLGFRVAPETFALMRDMVASGELDSLVAERIWQETRRALMERSPDVFIKVLRECAALQRVYPEIERLFGVPQPEQHHPEVDTGEHLLLCLQQAASMDAAAPIRFAVLVHDLGKGTTPREQWPRHRSHEQRGAELVKAVCHRLRIPKEFRDLGVLTAAYHTHCHRALELRTGTVLRTLQSLDALRRPERFEAFLKACEIDARGRLGLAERAYPQAGWLRLAQHAAAAVDTKEAAQSAGSGPEIAMAIRRLRLRAIADAKRRYGKSH